MNNKKQRKREPENREEQLRILAESAEPIVIKLTNDYAFKKTFSNKKVMKRFLNAALPLEGVEIEDIEFMNTFLLGDALEDREGILDIRIHLANKKKINIEMQVAPSEDWPERSLFYTARMYTEKFHHREAYATLEPCIHIGILCFTCMQRSPDFYHIIRLGDEKTGEIYSDRMMFLVIELNKVEEADEAQKQSELWKWAQLINTNDREVLRMLAKENEGMSTAVEEMDRINRSPEERYLYLRREMAVSDRISQQAYSEAIGQKKGEAIGQKKGEAIGQKKGEAIGQKKGEVIGQVGLLMELVKVKVMKGTSLDRIADALEKDKEKIRPIYDFVKENQSMSIEELCEAFMKK